MSHIAFALPDPLNYKHRACNHFLAEHIFTTPVVNHIYNEQTGKQETINTLLASSNAHTWHIALSNKIGHLAKGVAGCVAATETIEFIQKHEVPCVKKVTYANMVCDYQPLKMKPMQICLTVGRDRLPDANDAGSPAATLLEAKLMLNSIISNADEGAHFFAIDLKDFFLATPMDKPEYMRLHSTYFFDGIKHEYDIESRIASDGYVYIRINKGMYRLKQAALLAYNELVTNLAQHGYSLCLSTTGLLKHNTYKTRFCLCVNDFGVKGFNTDDKNHFLNSLQKY